MPWASRIPHQPPDLDVMTAEQLRAFIDGHRGAWWANKIFPTQPRSYTRVARTLMSMAICRLKYLETNRPAWAKEFEKKYKKLPRYAKWRLSFNPLACALPGKKFRKNPPKNGPKKGLDLTRKRT